MPSEAWGYKAGLQCSPTIQAPLLWAQDPTLIHWATGANHCFSCCSITKLHQTLCDTVDCTGEAPLSSTISCSWLKFMSIESVMLCNHFILCLFLWASSVKGKGYCQHPFAGMGFPGSSVGKEFTCKAGDPGTIPGLGRSTGEGIGYPVQYSWVSLVAQLVKNPPAM